MGLFACPEHLKCLSYEIYYRRGRLKNGVSNGDLRLGSGINSAQRPPRMKNTTAETYSPPVPKINHSHPSHRKLNPAPPDDAVAVIMIAATRWITRDTFPSQKQMTPRTPNTHFKLRITLRYAFPECCYYEYQTRWKLSRVRQEQVQANVPNNLAQQRHCRPRQQPQLSKESVRPFPKRLSSTF